MKASSRFIAICALFGAGLTWVDFAGVVSAPRTKPPLAARITPSTTPNSFVANEVLLKFKPTRSAHDRIAAASVRGHGVVKELRQPGWVQVRIRTNETVEQALAAYQNDPDVEHVQPNYIYRTAAASNDPHYGQLWALKNIGQTVDSGSYLPKAGTPGADINIEKAWDHITDCSSVIVAVIDTGVNYNHEDLAGNLWNGAPDFPFHGWDFISNDNDPMDLSGHGTHVAAIIGGAGNNATGATGVCWKASIMALRALDASGLGHTATIIQAIDFAVNNGARVVSISLGGSGGFDLAFRDAIERARANDVVVVSAAGNGGVDIASFPFYPCSFGNSNLLCVTALTQTDELASFSNIGLPVNVGAPGTNILSSTTTLLRSTLTGDFDTGAGWTSTGGWGFWHLDPQFDPNAPPYDALGIAYGYPTSDQRIYRNFDLRGKSVAILNFSIMQESFAWPWLAGPINLGIRNGGGDPFSGGVLLSTLDGSIGCGQSCDAFSSTPYENYYFIAHSYDISACAGTICSVGFRLPAVGGLSASGTWTLIRDFSIDLLQLNNTSYETRNGTSIAATYVAGLAAMLRAYNPQYTYADVVSAIRNGGRTTPALQDKTSTGKAVDFMSSLAHIHAPTGLRAAVQ